MDKQDYEDFIKGVAEGCVLISKRDDQDLFTVISETVQGCEYVIYPKFHVVIYLLAENPTPFMLGDSLASTAATAETITQAVLACISNSGETV